MSLPAAVLEERSEEPAATPEQQPTRVIRPRTGWIRLDLLELVRYRDLLWFLTKRDISLRYRQTALGVAWAVIQPLATMAVFTIFFGRFGKIPSDGVPYPLFAFCGLIPWQLFAYALSESSNSLVNNQSLVTKVYFPRLVIPLSAVLSGLMDLVVSSAILVGMLAWFGKVPTLAVLLIPAFVLLAIVAALGVGLWLSALNVQYRDIRYTIPFLTQIWFFATPIAYPSSLIPERFRALVGLNPMAGVVEGFRWALLGTARPTGIIWVSIVVTIVMLIGGLFYFSRMERRFADVV
jgi:lipopolysaccharide transport system permease protein